MKKILFSLTIVAMLFTACNDDDDPQPNPSIGDELKGDITTEVTLDASVTYSLTGTLSVKDGGVLNIPAGTMIKATKGFSSYVIVEQGGKINAIGTSSSPITFTSAESSPASGDWGGLIINGYAPISGATAGTTGSTEIDENLPYGGTNAADNSGTLSYVILAYTGARSTTNIEHNGLTLNGVGSGTIINNIYVPEGSDDGVEFFGGTVNVSNLLVVNPDDDMFDVTQGWSGTLDNAYGIWENGYTSTEDDPRGVEADGNLDGNGDTHVGQSDFTMSNITIKNASGYVMEDGIKIRRGATANITNALLIGGTAKDQIDLTDGKGNAGSSTSIDLTVSKAAYTSNEIKKSGDYPDVEISTGNTGASVSAFGWTGYQFDSESTVELKGDVTEEMTLNALYTYNLNGTLSVKDGGVLNIPAGTMIKATKGFSSYVIVEQGGKIMAKGTSTAPITFTSAESTPASGDWGGLVVNGKAPISGATAGTTGSTEIDENLPYGGTVANDNSGIIEYVILAYTGARSTTNIEHNGLTLNGVGSETVISNIYIPEGSDDGVEFFGGTVNVSNLLVVNPDDDMFDVTQGWSGTLSNAYGIWENGYTSTEDDPRGVEADGNLDGNGSDHVGQSNFTMEDITIKNNSGYTMEDVIKIRRGATATISNALLIGGAAKDLVDLTDSKGVATDATSIAVTNEGVTFSGSEIKRKTTVNDIEVTSNATITIGAGSTGATVSAFDWTGYSF